ncbi:hypothetical protein FEZ51_01945 [Pediococcus stilesii]|uniref:DUF968 domain-containing protein n=1 Tax=Pediococcus stilesii TaxID=331679 RepID=A0A5R9BY63_9LACO|nr:putative HNHc nuclease [Pediococcus stilesii]TLQ05445.1 hypothetical protein FEZ51_01945 [Pediococcus stilesii]
MFKLFGYFKKFAGSGLFFLPKFKLTEQEQRLLSKYEGGMMEIRITDPRQISAEQRAKIYAMFSDIDEAVGNYLPELTKVQLKRQFCTDTLNEWFSLSDCSLELAKEFIDWLIEFCLAWNIPWATRTMDMIQGDYLLSYYGLKYRQCCICRKPAQIAHVHAVGSGRDRNKISHIGNYVMPLCDDHHKEQHRIGINTFMNKYQIKGVRVDQQVAEMLKLGDWRLTRDEK